MQKYLSFLIALIFVINIHAQVDSKNKSIAIPAIKSKKDSASSILLPPKSIKPNTVNGMSIPKTNTVFSLPKKAFSMFPQEEFVNPGELYETRLDKKIKEVEVELGLGSKGSTTDQYFGDFKTKSKFINVFYRDFGLQDGDLIRVLVNDEILKLRVLLTNGRKGFKLDLKEGFNKIDFLALNEGYSLPNTAEFYVVDEEGKLIAGNQWNLSTGVKATIIVIKE